MTSPSVRQISLALVHYPVLDREGGIVTTAITNLDVHDISRSARTYGLRDVIIVHPIEAQRQLVERVRAHWLTGAGGERIPDRKEALALVRVVPELKDAIGVVAQDASTPVEVWTTAAKARGTVHSYNDVRARLRQAGPPVLLVFGTGWGLSPAVLDSADVQIAPIEGHDGWNHLSVRAACAITLDRLLSPLLPKQNLRKLGSMVVPGNANVVWLVRSGLKVHVSDVVPRALPQATTTLLLLLAMPLVRLDRIQD